MSNVFTQKVPPKLTSIISIIAMLIFLPFLVLGTYEVARIISRASGTPANIIIDNNVLLEPVSMSFIHAFAQGGEESTNMLSPIISEVKALKPKYIRLDHLYDHYDVVGGGSGNLSFNWQKLDEAVDTILQVGAKPVLALTFMPSVIAKDGSIINPPNNWDDWKTVVQKTIEHYSGEKGISGIYYEVWNEPDLDIFGKWKIGGEKDYMMLYRYASEGAQSAQGVSQFSLCGPVTTGLYKNWVTALAASGYRVNCLSWHTYLSDPTRYAQDQENLRSWLEKYPKRADLPQLITEFGFTGAKDVRYGTSYAAAHAASVIRQLISGGPKYLFTFQLIDGPGQESGDGWGLYTHETNGKRAKPRYGIYSFLDPMSGTRLKLTGEGSWVTGFAVTSGLTIRVLLVNFDQRGSHTEAVPVQFTNLVPGTFTYRQHFYQGQDTTITETVTQPTLAKQIFMPAQSIVLLELTKQL